MNRFDRFCCWFNRFEDRPYFYLGMAFAIWFVLNFPWE